MNIEEVAKNKPEKIKTTKINLSENISDKECEDIIEIFNLKKDPKLLAISTIKSLYKMFLSCCYSLML